MQTDTNNKPAYTAAHYFVASRGLDIYDAGGNVVLKVMGDSTKEIHNNAQGFLSILNNYSKLVEENANLYKQLNAESDYQALQRDEKAKLVEENERLRDALGDSSNLLRHLSEHLTDSGKEELKRFYSLL